MFRNENVYTTETGRVGGIICPVQTSIWELLPSVIKEKKISAIAILLNSSSDLFLLQELFNLRVKLPRIRLIVYVNTSFLHRQTLHLQYEVERMCDAMDIFIEFQWLVSESELFLSIHSDCLIVDSDLNYKKMRKQMQEIGIQREIIKICY